ncbi:hypothetical protein COX00_01930 [Candidatus Uhrbacteria bacterium CG22_combo_CG10-13_8_21_14_all_47_17]|uniref:DM13 domain-containing protein n=1 Tax=Candidatus Uhrbacteria bacterium CG22_combo_CG10-13_8_21_14_all_47_17 TaxID=1975041 RepID=A0A2H0BUM5_9BACT|nr:MAG: hypothetical protein COX00_01930 [Candidatus Uhrbacteria bacterium CG22_combo_CG10-13_8_21_14_all_47_17]
MKILRSLGSGFFVLVLLGSGCSTVPPYTPGEVPTAAQLEQMTPEDIHANMQTMLEKDPPKSLSEDERYQELMHSINLMKAGRIERFADFQGMNAFSADGSAKIVKNDMHYQVVFSEDFSVAAGPRLVVSASNGLSPSDKKALEQNGAVRLGELKASSGIQTYDLPEGFDINQTKSIVIFSEPFQTVFAVANIQ